MNNSAVLNLSLQLIRDRIQMLQMFFISQAVQCQVKLPVDQTAFKGEIEILNCCRKLIIYSRYLYAFHRKGLIVLFSFRNFLKINIAVLRKVLLISAQITLVLLPLSPEKRIKLDK